MRRTIPTITAALLLLAACDDGPTAPTTDEVAGDYEATTLTVTVDGSTTDALAEGASLSVTLQSDGSTAGTFVVPGTLSESGQEETYDLAGTWSLSGQTVTFDHPADTFLRDMTLRAGDGRLEGEETFGSETVRVVLERP